MEQLGGKHGSQSAQPPEELSRLYQPYTSRC